MDIKTTRAEFNGSIILGIGSNSDILNFFMNDLNIKSDNYYNAGNFGWNFSLYELNNTLKDLNYDVYIIDAYRNSPSRNSNINYNLINKYLDRVIKNYNKKVDRFNWREKQKLNEKYIKRITKKLNEIISNCYNKEK